MMEDFTDKPNSFEVVGMDKVAWWPCTGTKVEYVKIKRQKKNDILAGGVTETSDNNQSTYRHRGHGAKRPAPA